MVTESPAVKLSASSTALILGGTTIPTPDDYLVELITNQYIAPTHPGQDIKYVAVTTPAEVWPVTGFFRLLGRAFGPPSIWGHGGAAWPDEPWWKLSGLFDLTLDQSVQVGLADLEQAMEKHGNDDLVIFGSPQGSIIANLEKCKLAEQYPPGTKAPDIDFVLVADANLPNGGLFARFPGLRLPIFDISFNGPAPTDTQFDTVEITRQYEWDGDFPLYPINLVALLNAFLSTIYLHYYAFGVSLAPDASTSPAFQGTHGDTSYYFFETEELPLFGPLRTLGVPERVIDVVEPFFRVIVELGYDRSIPPWEPTPARLIPTLNPRQVAADLSNAIREGINNALALIGSPTRLRVRNPLTADRNAAAEQAVSARENRGTRVGRKVGEGVLRMRTAVKSQQSEPPAVAPGDPEASRRKGGRERAATRGRITQTISAVTSVVGNGRAIVRSANGDNGSIAVTASPTRKTPERGAVTKTDSDMKKVVGKFPTASSKQSSGVMTRTAEQPRTAAAKRLSTWTMTREAITIGFDAGDGFLGRCRGSDITRFRCAGRRFVCISHPDYVDHVLHEARLKYVKSNDYEPIRVSAGINLLTDEGDSWAAHRAVLNPTFARRHLNGIVDLMIDPITDITDALGTGGRFDMHQTMVQTALRVVANSLFSQDFGPLVQSMNDLATRGLRHAERLQRLGLWGLMPRPAYEALHWLAFSGVRLPPPWREMQDITLTLDRAVNSIVDERLVHPTDSPDLLNVLLRADGGTWPRRRIRDEALTFMLAGHETTANAMSWFWYLMALHPEARDRMLAEVDDVLGTRRPCAGDLDRLPWTTACLQESLRCFPAGWMARRAIEDDVIGGHHIRRGTTVVIPIHHIHQDPRWWPDPEQFDPTRFLDTGAKDRPRSAYLPFGGGRRICIGQSLALMEMALIAAIMSQRFAFDLAPDHPVEFESTMTLRPKNGVQVIARSRS